MITFFKLFIFTCLATQIFAKFQYCPHVDEMYMTVHDVYVPNIITPETEVPLTVVATPKQLVNTGNMHIRWEVEGVHVHTDMYAIGTMHAHKEAAIEAYLKSPLHTSLPNNTSLVFTIYITDAYGKRITCVHSDSARIVSSEHDMWETLGKHWSNEHEVTDVNPDVFNRNAEIVRNHNAKKDTTYTMALNQFAHLTQEEFTQSYFGLKRNDFPRLKKLDQIMLLDERDGTPDEIDWVKKGAVTPVKNQGACGSCWAFSTTGALEGAYFLKTGKLVSFSEQELVNCDHVDQGCHGGFMDNANKFIRKNGGLCTESDFPYTAHRGSCDNKCTSVPDSAPHTVFDVPTNDRALEKAIARNPVSVAIEADQMAFQFYKRGVLSGRCGKRLDHGVLAVGYGTDANGNKFYKVKNSWGPSWGMDGYILIERDVDVNRGGGECGILLSASYPVF